MRASLVHAGWTTDEDLEGERERERERERRGGGENILIEEASSFHGLSACIINSNVLLEKFNRTTPRPAPNFKLVSVLSKFFFQFNIHSRSH